MNQKMEITDIYKVNYLRDSFAYVGLLRNQKKFNINDNVWFSPSKYQGQIVRGIIKGVELPPDENPEYIYKIQIPEMIAKDNNYDTAEFPNIICDSIFSTIEEAKESAKKNCEIMYKLQNEEIERYFEKFNKW